MADDTQTLDRLGPYRILRELGAGGMGTVYLADDQDEGRQVALKVLHPHLVEREGFFKRFQREAQAGEKVDHPNVVRTLDSGFHMHDGKPHCVLAMEYVEGQTLRDLLRDYGTVPEALVRELALQTAEGLAAIHEAGIVHRDLKPENVLITKEHEVRIMDLGVARWTQASTALTREGQFAGSLPYAAPEQFGQAPVGPSADLYALGVVLYELLSGRNPFTYEEPYAVMRAHLDEVPESLDRRLDDLSAYMAAVVDTLLEKKPAERFTGARTLCDVLGEGESSVWWAERERDRLATRKRVPRVPVRRETNVYGRDDDLAWLRAAWNQAKAGRGNTVLIEGEAGIGKSRLLDLFIQDMAADDAFVLYGSHAPSGGVDGLAAGILGHFGSADLEAGLRPYLSETPSLTAAFAAAIRRQPAPEGCAPLMGDALDSVCVQLVRALAAERPLLWVVDDLHFADSAARSLLMSITRAIGGHRVLLLLTTRPGLPEESLRLLGDLDGFASRSLARLGAREVVLLLQDAFRSQALAEKLGGRIALESDGVPFFVFEMIRGLEEGQFISRLPDGSYVETQVIERIEVPRGIHELVEVRLGSLGKAERATLDFSAVLGFEFDPALVALARGLPRVEVLETLAHLERRHGIVRAQARTYRFDHHQFQEVMYAALSRPLREEYHALAAQAYADSVGATDANRAAEAGEQAYTLAYHHSWSGDARAALPYAPAATPWLEAARRYDDLVLLTSRLLDTPDLPEAGACHLLAARGGALALQGRVEQADRDMEAALAVARALEDPEILTWTLAKHVDQLLARGRYGDVVTLSEETIGLPGEVGVPPSNAWRRWGTYGAALWGVGRLEDARRAFERMQSSPQEHDPGLGEAVVLGNLALVDASEGNQPAAYEKFRRAAALSRDLGDDLNRAHLEGNCGMLALSLGRYERAGEHLQCQLALARALGLRSVLARTWGGLGGLCSATGRLADAREHFGMMLNIAREIGSAPAEGHAESHLGAVDLLLGRREQAVGHEEATLEIARRSGLRPLEKGISARRAEWALLTGDLEEALRLGHEHLNLCRELKVRDGEAKAWAIIGACESRLGAVEAGTKHLLHALEIAQQVDALSKIFFAQMHGLVLDAWDRVAALHYIDTHEEFVGLDSRKDARFLAWQATGDPVHLERAKRYLDHLVEHAPADCRDSMIENVPLHRQIVEAWASLDPERVEGEHSGGEPVGEAPDPA